MFISLEGPEGSGKSHLAAIWAEQAGARSTSAHALSANAVPGALATGALVVGAVQRASSTVSGPAPTAASGGLVQGS